MAPSCLTSCSNFVGACLVFFIVEAFEVPVCAAILSWDANPEPNISYRVFTSVNDGSPSATDVGTATTFVPNILPGQSYAFYVVAYNSDGVSSRPSETVTYTAPRLEPMQPLRLLGVDLKNSGTWFGSYGSRGHIIATETPLLPLDCAVAVSGATPWTWLTQTSDLAGLQRPFDGRARGAFTWYSETSFDVEVSFANAGRHRVSLYFVDFDSGNRVQKVEVLDPISGMLLDSTEVTDFREGIWLLYETEGDLLIRVTRMVGNNVVLSGIFFD